LPPVITKYTFVVFKIKIKDDLLTFFQCFILFQLALPLPLWVYMSKCHT